MRVIFHLEFPKDIQKFAQDYRAISDGLSTRFRQDWGCAFLAPGVTKVTDHELGRQ